ncbi:hypothetical protein K1X76_03585 [bacterium]|nr:hypothetical protein [bacterium]
MSSESDSEINLLDGLNIIFRWKIFIVTFVFLVTTASIFISLLLPKYYKAEATLLPMGGGAEGGAGMMSMMLSAQFGLGGGLGGNSASAQLLPILTSKILAVKVINKYNFLPAIYPNYWDEKNKTWKPEAKDKIKDYDNIVEKFFSMLTITDDKKKQIITLRAVTLDPKLSAELVNSYIFEFQNELEQNTYTSSKRNRIFIEQQLQEMQRMFLNAGKELSSFYNNETISSENPFVDVDVTAGGGEDHAKSEQPVFASEQVPGANGPPILQSVINNNQSLYSKLADVKSANNNQLAHQIPQQTYFQYLAGKQKESEQMLMVLAQKYQVAKIEEAKEDLNFKVIDWAQVPAKKFKPARSRIVIVTFMMSSFVAIFLVFLLEYLKNNRQKIKVFEK